MAANVFDVVAKFCTVTTNFLKFFSIGSDGVAFMVGASRVGFSTSRIYNGSGLFLVVALGFKFMGLG